MDGWMDELLAAPCIPQEDDDDEEEKDEVEGEAKGKKGKKGKQEAAESKKGHKGKRHTPPAELQLTLRPSIVNQVCFFGEGCMERAWEGGHCVSCVWVNCDWEQVCHQGRYGVRE